MRGIFPPGLSKALGTRNRHVTATVFVQKPDGEREPSYLQVRPENSLEKSDAPAWPSHQWSSGRPGRRRLADWSKKKQVGRNRS